MPTLVGVSLRTAGKVYYYETGDLVLATGDWVVIETIRGLELGQVVPVPEGIPPEAAGRPPRRVIRKAEEPDFDQHFRNRLRAAEALALSRERVQRHDLPMKMLDAELTLDGSKVVLYFGAEARVDFRGLVRDLAAGLRKRIELHQVGARDRSALTGGLGPCGRECCCSSWIREFSPVSIKMAKEQGLSLNPGKISGSCGRLMCCLRYEYHTYRELRKEMPRLGDELRIPEGRVRVVAMNLARHTLTVEHPERGTFEIPAGRAQELEEAALCTSCSTPKAACETAPLDVTGDQAPGRRADEGRATRASREETTISPSPAVEPARPRRERSERRRPEREAPVSRLRESAEPHARDSAESRVRGSEEGAVRPDRESGGSRPAESSEERVRRGREPGGSRPGESAEERLRRGREPGGSRPGESGERRVPAEREAGERRPRRDREAGERGSGGEATGRRRPRQSDERRAASDSRPRGERPGDDVLRAREGEGAQVRDGEATRGVEAEAPRPERARRRPDGRRPRREGAARNEGAPERGPRETGGAAEGAKRAPKPHRRGRKRGRGSGSRAGGGAEGPRNPEPRGPAPA